MGQGLAQRVANRGNSNGDNSGKQVDQAKQVKLLGDSIRRMQPEFQAAMPRGAEATQIIRDALTEVRRTPKLAACDEVSVLGALMTCAQLNLRVGVLGQAWPVPFWDKYSRRFKAQLIIGYQGYRELAWRSGFVSSNNSREVREGDLFDYRYGLDQRLAHKPSDDADRVDRAVSHYYSIIQFTNGGTDFEVMSQAAVNYHRDRFASTRDKEGKIFGPWIEHPVAMGTKTVYLVVVKRAPKSSALETAIAADGTVRVDLTPDNPDAALHGEHPPIDGEVLATDEQKRRIHATLTDAEITSAATVSELLAKVTGREVSGLDDLSSTEADAVIERLAAMSNPGPLAEAVTELLDRPTT